MPDPSTRPDKSGLAQDDARRQFAPYYGETLWSRRRNAEQRMQNAECRNKKRERKQRTCPQEFSKGKFLRQVFQEKNQMSPGLRCASQTTAGSALRLA
jgi:hypothetical protein